MLCQEPTQKISASAQGKADAEHELVTEAAVIHGSDADRELSAELLAAAGVKTHTEGALRGR
jgi:hypothetical protein